jgi:hypothetical protein
VENSKLGEDVYKSYTVCCVWCIFLKKDLRTQSRNRSLPSYVWVQVRNSVALNVMVVAKEVERWG